MAQLLSQEEFEIIMSGHTLDGERYLVVESIPLVAFSEKQGEENPRIWRSRYNDGFYFRIGDEAVSISQLTPLELIYGARNYSKENDGTIPPNVFIDKTVDTQERRVFYQARIEPDELNKYIISKNEHLAHDVHGYYHTQYKGYQKPGNPDYVNILKNQPFLYSEEILGKASCELKEVLSINLPQIKEKIKCNTLVIVLVPRAKANQEEWYQQWRKTISEWCVEHQEEGFEDGCSYIIRHTDTPTTHLKEDGEVYPGITKETCFISTEIEGRDILCIDDVYTKGVNIDEDALQAIMDNKPKTLTFYSVAKTYKK